MRLAGAARPRIEAGERQSGEARDASAGDRAGGTEDADVDGAGYVSARPIDEDVAASVLRVREAGGLRKVRQDAPPGKRRRIGQVRDFHTVEASRVITSRGVEEHVRRGESRGSCIDNRELRACTSERRAVRLVEGAQVREPVIDLQSIAHLNCGRRRRGPERQSRRRGG